MRAGLRSCHLTCVRPSDMVDATMAPGWWLVQALENDNYSTFSQLHRVHQTRQSSKAAASR
jgi:hypothetical protein